MNLPYDRDKFNLISAAKSFLNIFCREKLYEQNMYCQEVQIFYRILQVIYLASFGSPISAVTRISHGGDPLTHFSSNKLYLLNTLSHKDFS